MRFAVVSDPLSGCVFSSPTRWPGRLKLDACPSEAQFGVIQQMPGTYYFDNQKYPEEIGWYVPQGLADMGRFGGGLYDYEMDPMEATPSGLILRRHQRRAITFIRQVTPQREGCILAGDMGLGKTLTTLQALHLDGYLDRPGIVCGPKPSRNAWCGERSDAYKNYGLDIASLVGRKNIDPAELEKFKWWFCHYDILQAWQPWLFAMLKPASIIFDESHLLMHDSSGRSKAALQVSLTGSIERRVLLTGTPIPNRRLELWNQLAVAQPRQWGSSRHDFGVRYCQGQRRSEEEGGHWEYKGESNTLELQTRLAGTLLRYTRYDIQDELPKMHREVIEAEGVEEEDWKEYHTARRDVVRYLQSKGKIKKETQVLVVGNTKVEIKKNDQTPAAVQLVLLNTLIGLLSNMKKGPALKAMISIMAKHSHLVVFTWRVDTAKWLYEKMSGIAAGCKVSGKDVKVFGPVSGEMKFEERKQLAIEFSEVENGIYIATRGSAGISINELSSASAALIVDLYWNTAQLTQAESRVHRDGNPHPEVVLYYLVVKNTVDDMMLDKLQEKAEGMASLSKGDKIGLGLVNDLMPSNASSDGSDLDALCAALLDMED